MEPIKAKQLVNLYRNAKIKGVNDSDTFPVMFELWEASEGYFIGLHLCVHDIYEARNSRAQLIPLIIDLVDYIRFRPYLPFDKQHYNHTFGKGGFCFMSMLYQIEQFTNYRNTNNGNNDISCPKMIKEMDINFSLQTNDNKKRKNDKKVGCFANHRTFLDFYSTMMANNIIRSNKAAENELEISSSPPIKKQKTHHFDNFILKNPSRKNPHVVE